MGKNKHTLERTDAMLKTAMGETVAGALDDPSVVEIMLNPDGQLWIERHGKGRENSGQIMRPSEAERVIRLVGSHIGQDVTREFPIVSAELPISGERFEGVLPPVAIAPSFSIRKPAACIFTLEHYISDGTMTSIQAQLLRDCVIRRKSLLIVGGTGSGKTTLANALLHEVAATGDRVVILEDTRELQCDAPDKIALRTQAGSVSMADLVRSTLRLRPDRIVVGEVRGGEALDLLKAWNTGHPGGIATVHANSAADGLNRLEQLISEKSARIPRALIAMAVDVVIGIQHSGGQRSVTDILEVISPDGPDGYHCEPLRPQSLKLITSKGGLS
ncbi:P-type conjugative transfer ATPase TrbB [Hyphomonas sp.]|uniref:P-type conjugative transfer ATPase TrbB n=1 Tax=Hyphomonas sp. TaxID=87 RepID=UPI0025BD3C68|nr:P-type conjugative transfer ATPase TrbB [Hyphomonas sp.]